MATFGATSIALKNTDVRLPTDLSVGRRPISDWSGGRLSDPQRTLSGAGSNAGLCPEADLPEGNPDRLSWVEAA
jgi:hypothetical protein